MKTTKVVASDKNIEQFDGDLLVYCIPEATEKELTFDFTSDLSIEKQVLQAYQLGDFQGKEGQTLLIYPAAYTEKSEATKDGSKKQYQILVRRVLAVGLGKLYSKKNDQYRLNDTDLLCELFRKAGGSVAAISAKVKASKIMICLPEIESMLQPPVDEPNLIENSINTTQSISPADVAESLVEGVLLGDYRFLKYKQEKKGEPEYKGLSEVKFYSKSSLVPIRKALKFAFASALAVCDARDMSNEPGNRWRASDFASYAQELAKKYALNCSVIDKEQMQVLGMGGLLAVNQGSSEPPKMVVIEYQPESDQPQAKTESDRHHGGTKQDRQLEKRESILLVGKGITFDSGGICVKQPAGMEDMKYDMCGGAAVVAVMYAVAQQKPNVGVVAIIPATDNLSGSSAMKPGDVIRHYNGVTSEIVNTDAEGRMVLADAIAYGIETFKPACVVDIATLTGAVVMGLGHHYSAVLGNNDELVHRLEAAAKRAGEPLWRLPLGDDYTKQIESKVADIKNTGGKSAGTITAGAYLEKFVGDTPWAHIDIAGTAWDFTEKSYIPKGPSGVGVRTFLELIRNWKTGGLNS